MRSGHEAKPGDKKREAHGHTDLRGRYCGSTSIRERNDAEGVVADVAWTILFCAIKRNTGLSVSVNAAEDMRLQLCAKPVGFVSQRASQRQHMRGGGRFVGPLVKHS